MNESDWKERLKIASKKYLPELGEFLKDAKIVSSSRFYKNGDWAFDVEKTHGEERTIFGEVRILLSEFTPKDEDENV